MFLPPRDKLDEFTRPVESIMRCEDFKSNFARRLSNRYISKSPIVSLKQDTSLKLPPEEPAPKKSPAKVTTKVENKFDRPKMIKVEHNGEIVKPPDKASTKSDDIRTAEMSALSLEVETLRWQLAQTEANRQMHLALLKQIVSFLNRVKEHMVCQVGAGGSARELGPSCAPRARPLADLPRSRSVLHVSKNLEYPLSPSKKLSTRKISKSISNVNGFKDYGMAWNESKVSLNHDSETAPKLAEEISRLITLANTVLSTKLLDLSCCNGIETNVDIKLNGLSDNNANSEEQTNSDSNKSLDLIEMDDESISQSEHGNIYEEVADILTPELTADFVSTSSLVSCGLENGFHSPKLDEKERSPVSIRSMNGAARSPKIISEKREFTHVANFVEDESGFSSMSSFQEIGIPIINIIPPTPCKETSCPLVDLAILNGDRWKALDLDKQTVQVFWV